MIAAILLAAGESTRMGEPKQLLDWRGQPLAAAQADALLTAGCRPVVIVLGAHAHRVRPIVPARADVQIATNHQWRQGRASSIRMGASAVPPGIDAVIVASVDQPTNASVVSSLAEALASSEALIAVPRYAGRNGHPPALDASLLPELRRVTERQEGLKQIRKRHADRTRFVDLDDPVVTINLNSPEDYRRALQRNAST